MSRSFTMVVLACASVVAMAATPASAAPRARAAKAHSIVGTLQKVDGQTLTVQTAKGAETVMLAPKAHINQGGKAIQASQLANDTGSQVKVRFTEANGQRQAQIVTVSPAKRVAKK